MMHLDMMHLDMMHLDMMYLDMMHLDMMMHLLSIFCYLQRDYWNVSIEPVAAEICGVRILMRLSKLI